MLSKFFKLLLKRHRELTIDDFNSSLDESGDISQRYINFGLIFFQKVKIILKEHFILSITLDSELRLKICRTLAFLDKRFECSEAAQDSFEYLMNFFTNTFTIYKKDKKEFLYQAGEFSSYLENLKVGEFEALKEEFGLKFGQSKFSLVKIELIKNTINNYFDLNEVDGSKFEDKINDIFLVYAKRNLDCDTITINASVLYELLVQIEDYVQKTINDRRATSYLATFSAEGHETFSDELEYRWIDAEYVLKKITEVKLVKNSQLKLEKNFISAIFRGANLHKKLLKADDFENRDLEDLQVALDFFANLESKDCDLMVNDGQSLNKILYSLEILALAVIRINATKCSFSEKSGDSLVNLDVCIKYLESLNELIKTDSLLIKKTDSIAFFEAVRLLMDPQSKNDLVDIAYGYFKDLQEKNVNLIVHYSSEMDIFEIHSNILLRSLKSLAALKFSELKEIFAVEKKNLIIVSGANIKAYNQVVRSFIGTTNVDSNLFDSSIQDLLPLVPSDNQVVLNVRCTISLLEDVENCIKGICNTSFVEKKEALSPGFSVHGPEFEFIDLTDGLSAYIDYLEDSILYFTAGGKAFSVSICWIKSIQQLIDTYENFSSAVKIELEWLKGLLVSEEFNVRYFEVEETAKVLYHLNNIKSALCDLNMGKFKAFGSAPDLNRRLPVIFENGGRELLPISEHYEDLKKALLYCQHQIHIVFTNDWLRSLGMQCGRYAFVRLWLEKVKEVNVQAITDLAKYLDGLIIKNFQQSRVSTGITNIPIAKTLEDPFHHPSKSEPTNSQDSVTHETN